MIATITARPNTPLELTPLRVEQDRSDFEALIQLDTRTGLVWRRG